MSLNIDQIRQLLIDVMHTHRKEEINRFFSPYIIIKPPVDKFSVCYYIDRLKF